MPTRSAAATLTSKTAASKALAATTLAATTLAAATLTAATLTAAALAATAPAASAHELSPDAQATLQSPDGEARGVAQLTQGPETLVATVTLRGLPQGWHAFHIHQTGDCSDGAAGFKASGGHLGVDQAAHGFMSEGGPHAGDLPNVYVDSAGRAQFQVTTERTSLDGSQGPALFDADGAAVVVHANPDDHSTDPAGQGGTRLACGVVEER